MKNLLQSHIEPDVLLVHKPVGISSFGLLRKLRPILGTKKIGHAGTLDPLASGLMIVGYNKGTKKMSHYLKLPKTYYADIFIGISTTTGDSEGDIVQQSILPEYPFLDEDIEQAVFGMLGQHTLAVPIYSAIKVAGKPLYQYARDGKIPPFIPEKEMNILNIALIDHYRSDQGYIVRVRCEVSSGSYIRTLAEEFGRRLGYPAHLRSLYRYTIAEFCDTDALRIDYLENKRSYAILGLLSNKYSEKSMNIDFQAKNYELTSDFRKYIARKISGLSKFYNSDTTRIFIDIEQNPAVQSGPELFRVGIRIDSPEVSIFTEEKDADIRVTFDKAYKEIVRITKTQRGKTQNLARRAGARIKSLFKRFR